MRWKRNILKKSFPFNPFKSLALKRTAAVLAASLACAFGSHAEAAPLPASSPQASSPSASSALVRLPRHVTSDIVQRSALVGRVRGADTVPLALMLKLRDPAGLDRLLQRQYTPGDPLFHHFISPAEFTSRFSPTARNYAAVAAWARASGLTVTHVHSTRLLLDVSGPASKVEAAFHVRLQNFQSPEGRVFHAPDTSPAVPAALAGSLAGVLGLQNSTFRHSFLSRPSAKAAGIGSGPAPYDALTPSDIKAAYDLNATPLTGKGQTLGLYELDGYTPSDINAYESSFGLPSVPLQIIPSTDGGVTSIGDGAGEVTLDIELMTALAPGATAIQVYEAQNGTIGQFDLYSQIAEDDTAKEISSSWGFLESELGSDELQAINTFLMQMASQGQSFYAASGDSGAYFEGTKSLSVSDPASQPYATGVGATSLNVTGPGGTYQGETTWHDAYGGASGGGVSVEWPLPDYQQGVASEYSTTHRNVPDVSLDGDPATGYAIYYSDPVNGTGFYEYGGTSCAAPLWAAFTALVNQQREANGTPDLGFPNPAIYAAAESAAYLSAFHDIHDDSNNLFYYAVAGYDNATGWGSFDGANLLALFAPVTVTGANPILSLTLTPASVVGGLSASGTVTLTNPAPTGGTSVALSVPAGPVTVPATVAVAAGATTADFTVMTTAVTASTPVTITATYGGGSQSATLTLTAAPASLTPASLTLDPASVAGGASSTGTVTLTGPAPAAGAAVTLSSSDPSVTVPASVAVPSGAVSATFPVTTTAVAAQVAATVTATLNGVSQTAMLTVQAPMLKPLIVTPSSVFGGDTAVLALALTLPAPAGGAVITLSSSDPSAPLPPTVTIPAGQTTASVTIPTTVVPTATAVTLSATYGAATVTTKLTVKAALLQGLSLAPATVIGGSTTVVTLNLGSSAPDTGVTAALSSSSPAAQVPATLFIPAGATAASVAVPTSSVSAPVTATITAVLGTATETAALTIQPVQVASLAVSPTSVMTGTAITGRLRLNAPAPAGGLSVALSSSGKAATVPATVLVPAGSATVTFPVATPRAGTAVIAAALGGASQTASITVQAAPGTTYPAGTNLISSPYDYSGIPLDSLFGYTGVTLAVFQPTTGAYAFTPTAPADAMHIGQGYWVNLPTAVTLSSVGTPANPAQDFSIALSPGWNQIGQPWTTGETVGSLNVSAGGTTVSFDQASASAPLLVSSLVYRYAPGTGGAAGGYVYVRDTDTLQPGLGYWVYAYQAATLIVPHH